MRFVDLEAKINVTLRKTRPDIRLCDSQRLKIGLETVSV